MEMISVEGLRTKREEWERGFEEEDVFHLELNPTMAYTILRKENGKFDVLCYFTVNKTWMVSLESASISDPIVAMKKLCQRPF